MFNCFFHFLLVFSLLPYFIGPGFIPQAWICRCKSWIIISSSAGIKIATAKTILMHMGFEQVPAFFRVLVGFEVHWEVAQKIHSSCSQLRERKACLIISELQVFWNTKETGSIQARGMPCFSIIFFLVCLETGTAADFREHQWEGMERKRGKRRGGIWSGWGWRGNRDSLSWPDEVCQELVRCGIFIYLFSSDVRTLLLLLPKNINV